MNDPTKPPPIDCTDRTVYLVRGRPDDPPAPTKTEREAENQAALVVFLDQRREGER